MTPEVAIEWAWIHDRYRAERLAALLFEPRDRAPPKPSAESCVTGRADNLTQDTAVQEPKRPEELDFLPGAFHQADAVAEIPEIEETR